MKENAAAGVALDIAVVALERIKLNGINIDLAARLEPYKAWKAENGLEIINSQQFKLFNNPARIESGFSKFAWSKEWPPVYGFLDGKASSYILSPGTVIDRYGSPFGTFVSPVGTRYRSRALKPGGLPSFY